MLACCSCVCTPGIKCCAAVSAEAVITGWDLMRRTVNSALCMQPETVSCRRWKLDLQLNGKGKEGSRLLALRLFPTATELLKCVVPPPPFLLQACVAHLVCFVFRHSACS